MTLDLQVVVLKEQFSLHCLGSGTREVMEVGLRQGFCCTVMNFLSPPFPAVCRSTPSVSPLVCAASTGEKMDEDFSNCEFREQ